VKPPYLNTYGYADGTTCALDYYDDPGDSSYAQRFVEGWQQLEQQLDRRLRAQPWYFTGCPACRTLIMTSRSPGAELRCAACGSSHHTAAIEHERLTELRAEVDQLMGRDLIDISAMMQLVLVQPGDVAPPSVADTVCRGHGFAPVEVTLPVAVHLWVEAVEAGSIDPDAEHQVWGRPAPAASVAYSGEPTPEIESLLSDLPDDASTASAVYDPTADDLDSLLLRGDYAAAESLVRGRLESDPNDGDQLGLLTTILIETGRLTEARANVELLAILRPGADACIMAGRLELHSQRYPEAIEALESARALDPTSQIALRLLALAYERVGDLAKAGEIRARLAALGAGTW
jgi:hypothetical protein